MSKKNIEKHTLIEDLVENYPFAVNYLAKKNIRCIACGAPVWGTLEEACKEKGFSDDEINSVVQELNSM